MGKFIIEKKTLNLSKLNFFPIVVFEENIGNC